MRIGIISSKLLRSSTTWDVSKFIGNPQADAEQVAAAERRLHRAKAALRRAKRRQAAEAARIAALEARGDVQFIKPASGS